MSEEKGDILPVYTGHETNSKRRYRGIVISIIFCSVSLYFLYCLNSKSLLLPDSQNSYGLLNLFEEPAEPDSYCPITPKVEILTEERKNTTDFIFNDESFASKSRQRLLGAVRVPTEVKDIMINPNTTDSLEDLLKLEPLWKNFLKFHEYLNETFPLVHRHLQVEKINKLGLLYTWKGTTDKKPILLTAHQDVVPVQKDTIDQWTYPPFEGGFDGTYLYGRGVSDCKNLLIGLLETIELLISEGDFKPERTILLAFGYDEESEGLGAYEIGQYLLQRYGPDSIIQLIDEGGSAYLQDEGLNLIVPATAEKGHVNSNIELYTPGGHSSVPPDHTSIGILSKLVDLIESKQYESIITVANPVLHFYQCLAQHSKSIDSSLKKTILKSTVDTEANSKLIEHILSLSGKDKYKITTSQAADVVRGGEKSNALPEFVTVLVNQRIAVESSVKETADKILNDVITIAKRFDLGVIFEGETVLEITENGHFKFDLVAPLEPAPITPTEGPIWELFGGSLRSFYEDIAPNENNETFLMAPTLSTGNTDTKSYWDLTKNIYRYAPGFPPPQDNHVHSVDENLFFQSHKAIVAFYYNYLRVIDQEDDSKLE